MSDRAAPLARVRRGDLVESVHLGHLVARAADAEPVLRVGDPDAVIFPRSALKPVQAVAMVRAGLDLHGELLALAAASHSGESAHLDGVRRILAGAGLDERALDNTPDVPLGESGAAAFRATGRAPSPIAQNCSGKHAAMLATCVVNGWPTGGYRDPDHPLQRHIGDTVAELAGDEPAHVTVDGCGAPLFSTTLCGLARAFARIATAGPGTVEGRVAAAVREHPWWLGGTGRPVTRFVQQVPGLVAKDGAEGVFAAALPDGRALAVKVLDGSARPLPAVVAAALSALGGSPDEELGRVDVLGHGVPVGRVEPAWR
ncbi:MAG: asparaginase [Actinomycetota bacterium]|nr:asparaginase [Actinomycetota bacterium]